MFFKVIINNEKVKKDNKKIISRLAVKAIIKNKNQILMVKTNKGDYKLPGGGVSKNENLENALKREVLEETGYNIKYIKEKIIVVKELKNDIYEINSIFEMKSIYYLCEINKNRSEQKLDLYEKLLNFSPIWINWENALNENIKLFNLKNKNNNPWLEREIIVLKKISEYFKYLVENHV